VDRETTERALVQDAVARGRAALVAGARTEATRWLDRAHRLAPGDGTITLLLASSMIGDDNPRAARLFTEVLATHHVRDAWSGLATAWFLDGNLPGARTALAEVLGRHALQPDTVSLASQVARAIGAPGWCGVTGDGVLVVHPNGLARIVATVGGVSPPLTVIPGLDPRINRRAALLEQIPGSSPGTTLGRLCHGLFGAIISPMGPDPGLPDRTTSQRHNTTSQPLQRLALQPRWPQANPLTVMAGERHLIGSPISLRAIGRVQGFVEAWEGGLRGWAWHPGDPETNPHLSVGSGRTRTEIVATEPADGISGLAPLAHPRSFMIPLAKHPAGKAILRVRGRDGRDLRGSPVRIAPGDEARLKSRIDAAGFPPSTVTGRDEASGPGLPPRRRLNLGWLRAETAEPVILVTHSDGGGVERRVQASIATHEANGRRAIVLRPSDGKAGVVLSSGSRSHTRFELPGEQPSLSRLLRAAKPVAAEIHHFLNHDPSVLQTIRAAGIPYDVHTHDFAWFCPRIALVGRGDRYCGEPAPVVCEECVAELGGYLHEDIRVTALLERSRDFLFGARRVIAPSRDAADRMKRHFPGISPIVIPHEDDDAVDEPSPIPVVDGMLRVCVAGAIGVHKGYHVLLRCARDAHERNLDLTFVLAGTTIDDQRLIDTGRVFITGPYQPNEAVALIRAQNTALALLPSIWPETWCLGLTELWRAGLRVAAFDIGAPAERIGRTGRGFLLPLGLPPAAINDTLLNAARGRSLLPIRRGSGYKTFR
jgi:glycosyltransferase involved in cell wall biosynthesis